MPCHAFPFLLIPFPPVSRTDVGLSGYGDLDFHSGFDVDDDLFYHLGGGVQAMCGMLISDLFK